MARFIISFSCFVILLFIVIIYSVESLELVTVDDLGDEDFLSPCQGGSSWVVMVTSGGRSWCLSHASIWVDI